MTEHTGIATGDIKLWVDVNEFITIYTALEHYQRAWNEEGVSLTLLDGKESALARASWRNSERISALLTKIRSQRNSSV